MTRGCQNVCRVSEYMLVLTHPLWKSIGIEVGVELGQVLDVGKTVEVLSNRVQEDYLISDLHKMSDGSTYSQGCACGHSRFYRWRWSC